MARDKHPIESGTTPTHFPELPPPETKQPYVEFILHTVMDLQKSVGDLTRAVDTLIKHADDQGKKLDSVSHRMYAAGVVITILVASAGFILDRIWDVLITAMKTAAH